MNPLTQITNGPLFKIFLTMTIFLVIVAILPDTPFMQYLTQLGETPYLNWLNWFIPIGQCCAVMAVWWTAIVTYYAISWILRQIGVIGS